MNRRFFDPRYRTQLRRKQPATVRDVYGLTHECTLIKYLGVEKLNPRIERWLVRVNGDRFLSSCMVDVASNQIGPPLTSEDLRSQLDDFLKRPLSKIDKPENLNRAQLADSLERSC